MQARRPCNRDAPHGVISSYKLLMDYIAKSS